VAKRAADSVEFLARCESPVAAAKLEALGAALRLRIPLHDGREDKGQRGPVLVGGTAPLRVLRDAAANKRAEVPRTVEWIEASRAMVGELDISCVDIGRTALAADDQGNPAAVDVSTPASIVGVIDGPVDYTHPDFLRDDGTSRILYLWDQGAKIGGGDVPFGVEYTRDDLNRALTAENPHAVVPHLDIDGHGTHVAGIAAGNGRAEGGKFCGVAPGADLIVVALDREDEVTVGRSVALLEALDYVRRRAAGRPVSINLSQGMNGGGHCGETLVETGIDALARTPGVVVVKSAGNEHLWKIHAGGELRQGTRRLELDVASNDRLDDLMEIWFDSANTVRIGVLPPGHDRGQRWFVVNNRVDEISTTFGNVVRVYSEQDMDGTGDTCVTLRFSSGKAPYIQPGVWTVLLDARGKTSGRFDAWIERTVRSDPAEQMRFTDLSANATRTITVPGTAREVITVGAYVTRALPTGGAAAGALAPFTSRGPTRYGAQKPEISAPGQVVVAPRSCASEGTGSYAALSGTSMAAPHVTGAAALVLGQHPQYTCGQVKQILMRSARRDAMTSGAPDNAWGEGKLDLRELLERARTAVFPRIFQITVQGATCSWRTDVPTRGELWFTRNRRHLQLGKSVLMRASPSLGKEHSVELQSVPPGSYFCAIVAFSEQNYSSTDDNGGGYHEVTVR